MKPEEYQHLLEEIADVAEDIVYDASALQECLNPESYEVSAELILRLGSLMAKLMEANDSNELASAKP